MESYRFDFWTRVAKSVRRDRVATESKRKRESSKWEINRTITLFCLCANNRLPINQIVTVITKEMAESMKARI